jgi:hypothetical protein
MKKHLLVQVFSFSVIVFLTLAFGSPSLMAEDEIVFGVIEPLSGPFKDIGDRYVNAVKFAVEQINAEGGLLGKKVVTVVEDNALKPAISTRKAKKIILKHGAKFIMTGTGSHNTLAMAKVARKYKVINFSYGTEAALWNGGGQDHRVGIHALHLQVLPEHGPALCGHCRIHGQEISGIEEILHYLPGLCLRA